MIVIIFLTIVGIRKNVSQSEELSQIGVIMPLSGPVAELGEGLKRALDMAEPKNVRLVYEDDQCNTAKAISAYQKLKLENIRVFFVACSGSVMALAPIAKNDGNLIITGYAGSAEIRKTGDEVIRFDPDAVSIANALIRELSDSVFSGKKFALLYEIQDYAKSASDLLKKSFGDRIIVEESYNASDTTAKTQIAKLKSSGADLIILIPVADKIAQIVLKEMRDIKIGIPIVGEVNLCGYPFKPSDFGLHGFCIVQKINTPGANQFENAYKARYRVESRYPVNDGTSHDSIVVVDRLIGSGVRSVRELKSRILSGVEGNLMKYDFEPNGEVIDRGYFTKLQF